MMNKIATLMTLVSLPLVAGCGTGYGLFGTAPAAVAQSQRIVAVGHGALSGTAYQLSLPQQRLMAMRAARVDAYRNLAEQVYGVRVWGSTSVSSFSTQNDGVRAYVDAVIHGARLVNLTQIADGAYEATLELELPASFNNCVASDMRSTACGVPPRPVAATTCDTAGGCVQPSAYYYSTQ